MADDCASLNRLVAALFSFLAVLGVSEAGAQEPARRPLQLSLGVSPTLAVPLFNSTEYFTVGGGLGLTLNCQIPGTVFFVDVGTDYTYSPTTVSHTVSLVSANLGTGLSYPVLPFLSVVGSAQAGWWFGTYNDDTSLASSNPFLAAGAGVRFTLSPIASIEAGARYQWYAGLSQALSVNLGTTIALSGSSARSTLPDFQPTFLDAFPVFYKHYDNNPIGQLSIENRSGSVVSNVRVQLNIKQYMDEPKETTLPGSIAPGDSVQMNIYALLTDSVLSVTEGTKVAAQLTINWDADGQPHEEKRVVTVSFYGRNAMTWDDDRKAAAYVTAKDPPVLSFARSITSSVQGSEKRSINQNLQAAIALHEALDLYGLNYVPSPTMPYEEASQRKTAVDFLQFPRETLEYKSGDCSDISILYSALLQAVGIETAFITIPGHIFVAFTTTLTPEQAAAALIPASEYIAWEGKAWIPVEITMRHEGFLKAWELGAKEWNENNPRGEAGFFPVQDAWKAYQPVGLPGMAAQVAVPPIERVLASYQEESTRWIENVTFKQIQQLQEKIQQTNSVSAINRLGILYAKFGQLDKAEVEFKRALQPGPYLPAILNLGNLFYIQDQWEQALRYYQQAFVIDAKNPRVLLAIAKADQELSRFDDVRQKFEEMKSLDPTLAREYAYLGEGSTTTARSADVATERESVLWEDE